ncbi:MAG: L-serine ammonia-lyase [Acidobacteriaceae bacterium]
MNTSLFELFKIGIGPSSSHTVGPMRAALRFVRSLAESGSLEKVASVTVDLYGSLALTGIGHGTDRAILLGLLGEAPDTVNPAQVDALIDAIRTSQSLHLGGKQTIPFRDAEHLLFHRNQMYPSPGETTHPNGIRFTARATNGDTIASDVFYSVGGGFILSAAELASPGSARKRIVPHPYSSAAELLALAAELHLSIAELVLANEVALLDDPTIVRPISNPAKIQPLSGEAKIRVPHVPILGHGSSQPQQLSPEAQIKSAILTLWHTMESCIARGIATEGTLPGGLNVRRRAPGLARRLERLDADAKSRDPLAPMDSVTLVAMAVNEENAAGGRVVTAPTNGAAGVIPAVAYFYMHHCSHDATPEDKEAGLMRYFLTAAAIGILYKENASISGAEVGCQGEVGVACSMAAGGLVAALGGDNNAIESAAEIGMEHNLGMTCDPIGGLVQIPCIERNGMGAVKAVNACRLAMNDPGAHKVSLDQVIETMYRTGMDMQSRYKETSLAGLALNIIEC